MAATIDCSSVISENEDNDDVIEPESYYTKPHVFVRPTPPEQPQPPPPTPHQTCSQICNTCPNVLQTNSRSRHQFASPIGTPIATPTSTPVQFSERRIPLYSSLPSFRYTSDNSLLTSAVSILVSCLIAVATFTVCFYYQGFTVLVSTTISVFFIWLPITFALSSSIACRCIACCCIGSTMGSGLGRFILLSIITSLLLHGPVIKSVMSLNSCHDTQVSYESLITNLEKLSSDLPKRNTMFSEQPFGLGKRLENDLSTSQLLLLKHNEQLKGVTMTCRRLVVEAHNECLKGIEEATQHCANVIESFADVYRRTKQAIDLINPDRLASPKLQTLFKRQSFVISQTEGPNTDKNLPHKDVCRPLMESTSCDRLNDTSVLCTPISWSSQYLGQALNRTVKDIELIKHKISKSYSPLNVIEHDVSQRNILYAMTTLIWIYRLLLLTILLIIYESYCLLKLFLCDDNFCNGIITQQVCRMDRARQTMGRSTLLPLRRHEQYHLDNTISNDHKHQHTGVQVVVLHFALSSLIYGLSTYVTYDCDKTSYCFTHCIVIISLYVVALIGCGCKRIISQLNIRIAEWFYPKRARQRADWFIGLLVSYKRDVKRHLSERANINRFRREAVLALRHQLACGRATCDSQPASCLVCQQRVPVSNCSLRKRSKQMFIDCNHCNSIFCDQCYADNGESCILCSLVGDDAPYRRIYEMRKREDGLPSRRRENVNRRFNCNGGQDCNQPEGEAFTRGSSSCLTSDCRNSCSFLSQPDDVYLNNTLCSRQVYEQSNSCGALL